MKTDFKGIGMFFTVIICCCVPSNMYLKDKTYDAIKEIKPLYLYPINSISVNDSAKIVVQYLLKINAAEFESYSSGRFLYHFKRLCFKCFNKDKIKFVDTSHSEAVVHLDSLKYDIINIPDNKNASSVSFRVPQKHALDSVGISCAYIFIISDVSFYFTEFTQSVVVPVPGIAVIGGSSTKPAYGIKGKYLIWDYTNNRAAYAGPFSNNLETTDLKNRDELNMSILLAVYHLLASTPFWKISPSDF